MDFREYIYGDDADGNRGRREWEYVFEHDDIGDIRDALDDQHPGWEVEDWDLVVVDFINPYTEDLMDIEITRDEFLDLAKKFGWEV